MKVLQIIQKPQLRGAEIFTCQLSCELKKRGVEVDVLYLFHHTSFKLDFDLNFIALEANARRRLWDFKAYSKLNKIIKNGRYDIVQANAGDTLKYTVLSKILFAWKAPLVYRNANMMGDFITSKSKYILNKYFVSKISKVISVSDLCKKDFRKTFGYPSTKIIDISIGIDLKGIAADPEDLRDFFINHKVIVNVGSLVPEKNHQGLLRIFANVSKQVSNARLIIIGEGKLRSALEADIEELGLSGKVMLAGNRNDVLPIVKAASAFVLPSFIEGLPAVLLEAMYCRTPVVASNVGGISEIIQSGETGWLLDKGDEKNFSTTIIYLLTSNDNDIKPILDNAFNQVVHHYDNKIIAERFLKEYQQLLVRALQND